MCEKTDKISPNFAIYESVYTHQNNSLFTSKDADPTPEALAGVVETVPHPAPLEEEEHTEEAGDVGVHLQLLTRYKPC